MVKNAKAWINISIKYLYTSSLTVFVCDQVAVQSVIQFGILRKQFHNAELKGLWNVITLLQSHMERGCDSEIQGLISNRLIDQRP